MADKVKMKALRTFLRTGGMVQAGETFEATGDEVKRYSERKNPLAEPTKVAKTDDSGKKGSTKKGDEKKADETKGDEK